MSEETKALIASRLYRCATAQPVTVTDAVRRLPAGGLCLVCTPGFCGFAERSGEGFTRAGGGNIDTEAIFELRCFRPDFELRWVRGAADGTGSGVLISEGPIEGWDMRPEAGEVYKHAGRYLLWGKGTPRAGRTRLFEHRVGELPLPGGLEIQHGQRAWLTFNEYFSPDEFSNRVWKLERLTGLTVN